MPVIELYRKYSLQWRMSARGAIALDMTVFFHELDRKGVAEDEYDRITEQLMVVEGEALRWINKGLTK